jgi:dolichol-phosphate mannosyltransferase
MTILVVVPLVPLAFLAMLRVAERGTPYDAILLAVVWAASLLAWSKMGATLALPLGIFALWLFVAQPECRANLVRGLIWFLPAIFLLGVLPLLPLLREHRFMTVFELDPFSSWQNAYSAKTATGWFDRAGALFNALPPTFHIDRGGYYLGLVGLAAVIWTICVTWREARPSRELSLIRLFLLIALAMFWISFGPRNVLQGHFAFLEVAENLQDFAIPLHWLALAAQGFLIYWCLPRLRRPLWLFVVVFALYLLVPAFRVIQLIPVYGDLRAPDSFWILNGTFAWAVASALSLAFLLKRLAGLRMRALLAVAALIIAGLDFTIYFSWFYRGGLSPKIFTEFHEASVRLKQTPGRVLMQSGRYFYLSIPNVTGRPLSTEALNHYLLQRDLARLQGAAAASAADMLCYLQLGGIGSVILDRNDPELSPNIQKWFRGLLPHQFENDSFEILSNSDSLFPAFFAASAVAASGGFQEYVNALDEAKQHTLTIASSPGQPPPSFPEASSAAAPPFARLDLSTNRTPSHVSIIAPGKAGWVVLSEAYHPDWKATVDGVSAPVYRGAGGFPAVPVQAQNHLVEFRFQPPAWYAVSLITGSLAWIFALGLLATARFLPPALRSRLAIPRPSGVASVPKILRSPVSRPLALIPTYNEAESITTLLNAVLSARKDLEVLVIDDSSPDGTAGRVRENPHFGTRIRILERPGKKGLGSAYRDGFRWAIEQGYDVCVEIDADLSHDPADIPRLLDALDSGFDAAIGSRYLDGVRVVNWPRHRLLLSTGASCYTQLLTNLPLTDATSGFKAFRTAALQGIDWSQLRADGYGFQIELHWLLWRAGFRIVEVPIVFTERRAGQTKMTVGIAIEAAKRVLQLARLTYFPRRSRS